VAAPPRNDASVSLTGSEPGGSVMRASLVTCCGKSRDCLRDGDPPHIGSTVDTVFRVVTHTLTTRLGSPREVVSPLR
jgi:hypothetical protein